MSEYLWLRYGDPGSYERFDAISEADLEYRFEKNDRFLGWVDAGFCVAPLYTGNNYVSCYWGNKAGDLTRNLSFHEKREIELLIAPPQIGVAVAQLPEDWRCTPQRYNQAIERAERFLEFGASDVFVWYNRDEDYVTVEFDLEGEHYCVQSYKIHVCFRNYNYTFGDSKRFDLECRLFWFFEEQKHRAW